MEFSVKLKQCSQSVKMGHHDNGEEGKLQVQKTKCPLRSAVFLKVYVERT